MAPTKKAVHFGGGLIGRGFVGLFEHEADYEVVFVDVVDDLIKQFQNTEKYTVTEISETDEVVKTVSNFRAVNSRADEAAAVHEVATADLVTSAVGPNILKFIAPVIAKGIEARTSAQPLAVIACENMIGATDALAGFVREKLSPETVAKLDTKARFANSAVDRIVPIQKEGSGLNVRIEKFHEWCVEEPRFNGAVKPDIKAIHYVADLSPYIERKLYTVNTAHASCAYYANQKGYKYIHEAMADPEIRDHIENVVKETAALIVEKYGIDPKEQKEYADVIVRRISNPALQDLVMRVGKDPIRKMGLKDRIIGPTAQLAERGMPHKYLLKSVEYCLRFQDYPGDDISFKLKQKIIEQDPAQLITELTTLTPGHALYQPIVDIATRVKADTK